MGALGGGAWHLLKGLKNSPSGYRVRGALESLRRESPRLGGSFANWGLTFSMFDCSLMYLRKKEDPWNAIWAGACTGGFLQLRFGLKSAAKSAAFGGFLLALIEGLGIALQKFTSPPPPGVPFNPAMAPGMQGPPAGMPGPPGPGFAGPDSSNFSQGPTAEPQASSGGFWSMFGGGGASNSTEPVKTTTFNEDPFTPPPMPKEFTEQSFK